MVIALIHKMVLSVLVLKDNASKDNRIQGAYQPRLLSGVMSNSLLLYIEVLSVSGVSVVVSIGKGKDAVVGNMRRGSATVDRTVQGWSSDGTSYEWVDYLSVSARRCK